jgi:mono/diheme cytochrome c family protein
MKIFDTHLAGRTFSRMAWIGLLFFGIPFALGQGENSGGSQSAVNKAAELHVYDELAKAPEKARTRPNPLATDPDAVAAGKKLFERHCGGCHGDTAEGGKKGPSLRATEIQQATPGTLFWLLTNGVVRRGMPVWSKLPEPQRWQIVSYLKSLSEGTK